ncbi:MAG: MFS transporter [Chloroflexia bacterium]|nr:MFS transporter [Chloroflexia bacterium]
MTNGSRPSAWDSEHLALTVGSILAVTIIAFQGLALATIAPVLAEEIGGEALYGWIFSAFLLPQMVGTVVAGQEVDRRSPAVIFLVFMLLFGAGLLVAGFAPNIGVLFVGRGLQGLGAGGMFSCVYAIINAAYEDQLRPMVLAALSSAWIVPSLIGPALAGFIAEQIGWRAVFFALLPLLVIVAPLTLPAYRRFEHPGGEAAIGAGRQRVTFSVVLALGSGLFLAGLQIRPWPLGLAAAVVGLALLAPTLWRLLPAGTFVARPMLPAAIAARGLFFAGFLVGETYMVRALKEFGDVSVTVAGVVVTAGSLSWTTGSWLQARLDARTGTAGRPPRVVAGVSLMIAGIGLIFGDVLLTRDIALPVAVAGWMTAGLGIGLAHATCASIAFADTPPGQEGFVASSTLLWDLFTPAIGIGLGGAMIAIGTAGGLTIELASAFALGLAVLLLLLAWASAWRLRGGLMTEG